ncbi:hypothetical protein [Evansella clarkii]|uniref:hypothetical protein n=1 Tax=Evansella clarkii TaxID=79879 RepID=UPI000B44441A|nr:hypothetical protein [Evansella clarkii]
MLRLDAVLESYGLKEGKWKIAGSLLETEKGLKRIHVWTDKALLNWHISWRDQLAENTGCLTDRMIQTVRGERMSLCDEGWITVHDEVSSPFSYKNKEKETGRFFGKYYSLKVEDKQTVKDHAYFPDFNAEILDRKAHTGKHDKNGEFVEAVRKEALMRYQKAKRLNEKADPAPVPFVCPVLSLNQARLVYEKMYWVNSTEKPESGYRSLSRMLGEWLKHQGEKSLFAMLDEMDSYFPLKNKHGVHLLTECLLPWEFADFIEAGENQSFGARRKVLAERWETSRALVKALSKWLDVTREQVKV